MFFDFNQIKSVMKKILFINFFSKVFPLIIKLNVFTIPHKYTKNDQSNINTLYESNIFTQITVGTPKKIINSKIIFSSFIYYLNDNINFYSKNYSSSYTQNSNLKLLFINQAFNYGYYCSENFYFKNEKNTEIKIENFPTILAVESNLEYSFYLGFNYYSSENYELNFIEQLKSEKYIDSYIFSFEFNNDKEGEIIIGSFPHNYNSKMYNENDLKWTNVFIIHPFFYWNIYFNNIIFDNKKFNGSTVCTFEYESNLIFAPIEYKSILVNKFINENKNKCYEIKNEKKHSFFICEKNINIKKIPKITFISKELNYEFEVDYNDLFNEINGKLYLLIAFDDNQEFKRWKLGIPFLKKYKFLFDQSKRIIGFYSNKKQNNQNISLVWLFILIVIIFVLSYVIYKVRIIKRKKRINEIEDNYEYLPQ